MKIYFRVMKGGTSFYDRAIRWYSRSPYTHAEFAWPLTTLKPRGWLGAQSSKMFGIPSGVQIRPSDYLDPCEFDLFSVDLTKSQLTKLQAFLTDQLDKPYDFRAIARMAIPQITDHSDETAYWFCSELVFYALAYAGVQLLRVPLKDSDVITPRDVGISTVAALIYAGVQRYVASEAAK